MNASSVDRALITIMTTASDRILDDPDESYEIALDAAGECLELMDISSDRLVVGGYMLWASTSDLADDFRGPWSHRVCRETASAIALDWRESNPRTPEDLSAFLTRWDPQSDSRWGETLPSLWRPSRPRVVRWIRRRIVARRDCWLSRRADRHAAKQLRLYSRRVR